MKKMMIVLASVVLGLSVQAAKIDWKTGSGIEAPTSATDGAFSGSNAKNGTLSMYVWLVDKNVYDGFTVGNGDIYSTYGSQLATADGSATRKGGAMGFTMQTVGHTANTPYYAVVLLTYDDGAGITGYIENKVTVVINTSGTKTTVDNLAKDAPSWSPMSTTPVTPGGEGSIPEPTSGLLLAIGGALLALRRKQK